MNEAPKSPAEIIERIMQTAKAALPDALGQDVKDNVRAALQDVIGELDIVTREELNIQKEVLKKTRSKVDEMENIIAELEKRLDI